MNRSTCFLSLCGKNIFSLWLPTAQKRNKTKKNLEKSAFSKNDSEMLAKLSKGTVARPKQGCGLGLETY